MKIESCRFERSAFKAEQAPTDAGPDVVFFGRSNVGKSSLINRLLGVKGLARTSSTPGRTQSVNLYRINERMWFVDLPGYGFAKVHEAVKRAWSGLIEGFLDRRSSRIALGILIVDARHDPTALDKTMYSWLTERELPFIVVGTKADKLSGNGKAKARRTIERTFPDNPYGKPLLVSAQDGTGVKELWRHLDTSLAAYDAA